MKTKIIGFSLFSLSLLAAYVFWPKQAIDYSTQVKPILNKKCIACHGGVKREANFSLLFQQEALAVAESGKRAIIPGEPENSELINRLHSNDPEERMPYKKEPLTKEEIAILTQWIKEGAVWGNHWAYVKVEKQNVPTTSPWAKNEIDPFIEEKITEQDLTPSPAADKATLLRRVSLDLVGLPPTPQAVNAFENTTDEKAYESLVDSMLASPHFGERWASVWLDIARYSDTKGYERDDSRAIWRYRDWLIRAFNKDMPYDQFITEQLAGDLLPDPTDDNYVASAFHRNTLTNDEGGTDNEEFRVAAVLDRVNTTWEGLMGTTFACVQCHSHPYDPFRHEEYYKFMAFFNNTRDEDTYADYPLLRHFSNEDSSSLVLVRDWIKENISTEKAKEETTFIKTWQPVIHSLTADQFVNGELNDTKWLAFRHEGVCRLKKVDLEQKDQLIYRYQSSKSGGVWQIRLDDSNGPVIALVPAKHTEGKWTIASVDFSKQKGTHDVYLTYANPNLKPEENGIMFDWFNFHSNWKEKNLALYDDYWNLITRQTPTTPIMLENTTPFKRVSQVFQRGNWLVKGDTVEPGVPNALNEFPKGSPKNRLGLSNWMMSTDNPLVSRTLVNRIWEQLYGVGLAETLEDLGTQGIPPTHQQLLDHLAWKLMNDYHWSMKKLIREIVMSATYRQSSAITPTQLAKDPFNKFYARAPRVRLSAEQVRDQALAVSGLLSTKMYGPGVMPYQPGGIWLSPWNGQNWKSSKGEDQYRRAIYTYWKRTAPYPSMITFDGATRDVCTSRRLRTNTPLQALVTLNDSVYVEASYRLAHTLRKANTSAPDQIKNGYQRVVGKKITSEKLAVLYKLYNEALKNYQKPVLQPVRTKTRVTQDDPEVRAMALVAAALLNLDEFITKN